MKAINFNEMSRREIFKYFRDTDESNLWPVCNKFNATERAIRRLYKFEKLSGNYLEGWELYYFLDGELSDIVNHVL